jgi:uncharacterized protein
VSDALQALFAGDEERARRLLPPDDELTVFEAAAFGRRGRLAEIIRDEPAQAQAFSADGFTPLHLAVFGRQEETARLLLEAGADPNVLATSSFARVPPLGTAAFVQSVELARLLLDHGADPNRAGEGGFTPLHAAAQNADEELARLLLERGADRSVAADDGRRPADFGLADLFG